LSKYAVAETDSFQKRIKRKEYNKLYKKIREYVYPILNQPLSKLTEPI